MIRMEQKRLFKRKKMLYMVLITVAALSVALCICLEIAAVAVGISYAASDDEVTAMAIQGVATGAVFIVSCVFTAAFYYTIKWLNELHLIEHTMESDKKRSLKPFGTSVEIKVAHMDYHHYPSNDEAGGHDNIQHTSDSDDQLDIPFLVMDPAADITDSNNENSFYVVDHIGGQMMRPFSTTLLQELSASLMVLVFLSCTLFLLGLMALIWGITLAYSFGFGDENVIWPFITVEVIVGIGCPLLMYIGILLFAVILDYVTKGKVDARKAVHSVLPSVELLKAKDNEYWVIKNTFYYLIRRRPQGGEPSSCTSAWDHSRATIYFIIIIGLSFGLSTSYFMNRTIVEQVNTRECRSDLHYDCFVIEDDVWTYVDCNDTDTLSQHSFLHCYTFLRFAIDNNPIATLAEAFAFHLATVAFFGQVFGIVKILLRLRASRLWGIWFVVIGLIIIGVSIFLMIFRGSFSLHRDVIGCFQILMIGLFLVIVGTLLFEAGLWEREQLSSMKKPVELHLFQPGHRHDLDRATSGTTNDAAGDTTNRVRTSAV